MARELVDLQINKPQEQEDLNCYVILDTKQAQVAATLSDQGARLTSLSAIDGIPIAVKDNLNVRNLPTRNGSSLLIDKW